MTVERHPTGADRLDDLLGGGLPVRRTTLLYGPRFAGKRLLARTTAAGAAGRGVPVVWLHTHETSVEATDRLRELVGEDAVAAWMQAGLLWHIDTVSTSLETPVEEGTKSVDGAGDLNGIAVAINEVQRELQGNFRDHVLILDSVSTLAAHAGDDALFRFLHVVLGRARHAGAATVLLLDKGMHRDAAVAGIRHLAHGSIELRDQDTKRQVHVMGHALKLQVGWVDYRLHSNGIEVTGSFAAGRIR